MASETSVVTPERFQQGFTYSDYIGQINVNKARFDSFYENFVVIPEEAQALKDLAARPNGPAKMLVLGEDWCGDVGARSAGPGPGLRSGRFRDEHIPQGREPRHYERVPEKRGVDVHSHRRLLHQRPSLHLPLD